MRILHILETGTDRIRSRIGKVNTLSLIGRALFFRFLFDREIVADSDVPSICQTANSIKECFDNAENTYRTSRWLDETFNGELIAKGTREEKLRSFDGKHLDKMPDLIFGVIGRDVFMRTQDGIFIECKPVDASHTAGVHYCDKGIIRFVRGDYAWCMLSAMMLGYAAEAYTVIPKLTDALAKSTTITTKVALTKCTHSKPVLFSQDGHVSVHKRNFSYVETGEAAPDITLRHLWLNRE